MTLKLRPTGLGSGIDKDRPDYTVYTGEWQVGRIYRHFKNGCTMGCSCRMFLSEDICSRGHLRSGIELFWPIIFGVGAIFGLVVLLGF